MSLASNSAVFLESLEHIIICGLREIATTGHLTSLHPHCLIYHMTEVLRSKFLVIDMRTITAKCIFFSCSLLKYDISSVILLLLYEVVLVIAHHLEHLLVLQLLTRR